MSKFHETMFSSSSVINEYRQAGGKAEQQTVQLF